MKARKSVKAGKETWNRIIQFIITVLTAVATTLGVTSCTGM